MKKHLHSDTQSRNACKTLHGKAKFDKSQYRFDDDDDLARFDWSLMPFGKYKGQKTLPEIICSDPGYFLYAFEKNFFQYGKIAGQAKVMYHHRIRCIKIPKKGRETRIVRYVYSQKSRFIGFGFERNHDRYSKKNLDRSRLDFTAPHIRHPQEWDNFLRCFFEYYFVDKEPTKEEAESFFSDPSNFIDP